jgi:hypothetical protein
LDDSSNKTIKAANEPFERFRGFMRRLIAVPKKEVEAEEAKWREARRLKKKSAPS